VSDRVLGAAFAFAKCPIPGIFIIELGKEYALIRKGLDDERTA
jgi:hypothetical protein